MIIKTERFGILECEVHVSPLSAVDSYIIRAVNDEGVELTLDELEHLDNEYSAEVQEYAYMNGSRNHN